MLQAQSQLRHPAAPQDSVWKWGARPKTSLATASAAARRCPGGLSCAGRVPRAGCTLHAPGPLTPALCHRAHLIKDDPGCRPRRWLYGPHRGPPRLPEEVSVGDIKERHAKMAPHLRQHLQHSLGDKGIGLKGSQWPEPSPRGQRPSW